VQIEAPKSFVGKTLKDLGLPSRYEVYVIGIKTTHPDTFTLVPSADTVIDHGHHLVLIGHSAQIKKIEKMSS
jgi:trk system potassium uptake protein TrkA